MLHFDSTYVSDLIKKIRNRHPLGDNEMIEV